MAHEQVPAIVRGVAAAAELGVDEGSDHSVSQKPDRFLFSAQTVSLEGTSYLSSKVFVCWVLTILYHKWEQINSKEVKILDSSTQVGQRGNLKHSTISVPTNSSQPGF